MASIKISALEKSTNSITPPDSFNNESKTTASILSEKIEDQNTINMTGDTSHESDSNYMVSWDGPLDPLNPVNFSTPLKIVNTGLITLVCCLNIAAIGILAPSVPYILSDFESGNASLASFVVSIYVLGLGSGPLVMAPLSEVLGRVPVFNLSVVGFILSNIGCAKSTCLNMLIIFRFFSGIFGSVTETNGGATASDLFDQSQRGAVLTLYALGPVVAGIVSPIIGGFITAGLGWRWVFWLLAIFSGVFGILGMIFLRETYAPVILKRKAARMQKKTGNLRFRSEFDESTSSGEIFLLAMVRPLKLLFLSPIILSTSLFLGVIFGYQYLLLTSYSPIFLEEYKFSISSISLSYLGSGVGSFLGLLIFGLQTRRLYNSQKTRASGSTGLEPERRLDGLFWTYLLIPIGILLYGWTAQKKLPWILPIVGSGIISCGTLHVFLCIIVYIIDCFPLYVASASTGGSFLRSCVGAVVPLAGPSMFQSLGVGWGCSLLALISCLLIPFPWAILKYGATLRAKFVIKNL